MFFKMKPVIKNICKDVREFNGVLQFYGTTYGVQEGWHNLISFIRGYNTTESFISMLASRSFSQKLETILIKEYKKLERSNKIRDAIYKKDKKEREELVKIKTKRIKRKLK